mgnify:CR=1 FL=1|jgi:hypothetical protein
MNCADCGKRLDVEEPEEGGAMAARLELALVCEECAEPVEEVRPSGIPAELLGGDLSGYRAEAIEDARRWGRGEIGVLTLVATGGLRGDRLAAEASRARAEIEPVRWVDGLEPLPHLACVVPDIDLFSPQEMRRFARAASSHIRAGLPLLLLSNVKLGRIEEQHGPALTTILSEHEIRWTADE